MNLALIVQYVTTDENYQSIKETLQYVRDEVRKVEGCTQFELLEDVQNSNTFIIYETWETKMLWQKHLRSPHMKEFNHKTEGKIIDFKINYATTL